jgi:hypothetical protein
VITYQAMLDVPRELAQYLSRLLHIERRRRGTRKNSRALTCFRQAVVEGKTAAVYTPRILQTTLPDCAATVRSGFELRTLFRRYEAVMVSGNDSLNMTSSARWDANNLENSMLGVTRLVTGCCANVGHADDAIILRFGPGSHFVVAAGHSLGAGNWG